MNKDTNKTSMTMRNKKGQFVKGHQGYKGNQTHGMAGTKPHKSWKCMKQRVNNPNSTDFHRWGGRGIKYHPDFETFEGWWKYVKPLWEDAEKKYPNEPLSQDRKNNDGDYTYRNIEIKPRRMNTKKTHPLNLCGSAVIQCDLGGNVVKRYVSISEAFRQTGINNISACCRGVLEKAGGYRWVYAPADPPAND